VPCPTRSPRSSWITPGSHSGRAARLVPPTAPHYHPERSRVGRSSLMRTVRPVRASACFPRVRASVVGALRVPPVLAGPAVAPTALVTGYSVCRHK
jgi:hypothetical protein